MVFVQTLLSLLYLMALVGVPSMAALVAIRRPGAKGLLVAGALAFVEGVLGGLLAGGTPGPLSGLLLAVLTLVFAAGMGIGARRGSGFNRTVYRTVLAVIAPLVVLSAAVAVAEGRGAVGRVEHVFGLALDEWFRLERERGLIDAGTLDEFEKLQRQSLHVDALMAPGMLLALVLAWIVVCTVQVARYARVWKREEVLDFRWPDWLIVPALLLGLVAGGLGVSRAGGDAYYVILGFVYAFAVPYFAQGLAVVSTFFALVRASVWIAVLCAVTLFPAVLGLGVLDLWVDFRARLKRRFKDGAGP